MKLKNSVINDLKINRDHKGTSIFQFCSQHVDMGISKDASCLCTLYIFVRFSIFQKFHVRIKTIFFCFSYISDLFYTKKVQISKTSKIVKKILKSFLNYIKENFRASAR